MPVSMPDTTNRPLEWTLQATDSEGNTYVIHYYPNEDNSETEVTFHGVDSLAETLPDAMAWAQSIADGDALPPTWG